MVCTFLTQFRVIFDIIYQESILLYRLNKFIVRSIASNVNILFDSRKSKSIKASGNLNSSFCIILFITGKYRLNLRL